MQNRLIQRIQRHARISTLFPVMAPDEPRVSRLERGGSTSAPFSISQPMNADVRPQQAELAANPEQETTAPVAPWSLMQTSRHADDAMAAGHRQRQTPSMLTEPQQTLDQVAPNEQEWSHRRAIMQLHEGTTASIPPDAEQSEAEINQDDTDEKSAPGANPIDVEAPSQPQPPRGEDDQIAIHQQLPTQGSAEVSHHSTGIRESEAASGQAAVSTQAADSMVVQRNTDMPHALPTNAVPTSEPKAASNEAGEQSLGSDQVENTVTAPHGSESTERSRTGELAKQPPRGQKAQEGAAAFDREGGIALSPAESAQRDDSNAANPQAFDAENLSTAQPSRLPLDAVLDVERMDKDTLFPGTQSPLPAGTAVDEATLDIVDRDALQRAMTAMPSSKPSDSSVETVLPRRRRPRPLSRAAADQQAQLSELPKTDYGADLYGDIPAKTTHEPQQKPSDALPDISPPAHAESAFVQRNSVNEAQSVWEKSRRRETPSPYDLPPTTTPTLLDADDESGAIQSSPEKGEVQTEIGHLPRDLWAIVGEKPPATERMDPQGESETRGIEARHALPPFVGTVVHRNSASPAATPVENDLAAGGMQDKAEDDTPSESGIDEIDLDHVSDLVYREIRRRIQREGERYSRRVRL